MQKVTDYIFNISPKKLALYLVLGPLVLFLAHTITTITFRTISSTSSENGTVLSAVLGVLSLFLFIFVLIWLFWIRSTVYSVEEAQLGLGRKWFQIAYVFLCFFVIFNTVASVIESLLEKGGNEYVYLIYASREFINFGGIMIAYPIVCHYVARATMAKRNSASSSFINAIPFTLLLIFGAVVGIPFMHKYFSTKPSTNSEIAIIYAIAFGLFITILIIGFFAAITGLV